MGSIARTMPSRNLAPVTARSRSSESAALREAGADTVADKLANHAETVGFNKFLNCRAYIADRIAHPRLLDALV